MRFYELQINFYLDAESADFASEVLGGTILDTPDTHSFYNPTQNQITILGIPLWKPLQHTPRKVIQVRI